MINEIFKIKTKHFLTEYPTTIKVSSGFGSGRVQIIFTMECIGFGSGLGYKTDNGEYCVCINLGMVAFSKKQIYLTS